MKTVDFEEFELQKLKGRGHLYINPMSGVAFGAMISDHFFDPETRVANVKSGIFGKVFGFTIHARGMVDIGKVSIANEETSEAAHE